VLDKTDPIVNHPDDTLTTTYHPTVVTLHHPITSPIRDYPTTPRPQHTASRQRIITEQRHHRPSLLGSAPNDHHHPVPSSTYTKFRTKIKNFIATFRKKSFFRRSSPRAPPENYDNSSPTVGTSFHDRINLRSSTSTIYPDSDASLPAPSISKTSIGEPASSFAKTGSSKNIIGLNDASDKAVPILPTSNPHTACIPSGST
jgi:hypothetical protein